MGSKKKALGTSAGRPIIRDLEDAARSLQREIFGGYSNNVHHGFVGLSAGRLYVFVRGPKERWRGKIVESWQGHDVTYWYDVGTVLSHCEAGVV